MTNLEIVKFTQTDLFLEQVIKVVNIVIKRKQLN